MTFALALVLALVGASPSAAPEDAGPGEAVLVLPLSVGTTVSAELAGDLQATLERGLGRGRLSVLRDTAADACTEDTCVRHRAEAREAELVLRGTVDESERNFAIALSLLDASTLEPIAQSRRECEVCGSAEVLELLEDQAAALAARPAVERPVTGALVLRSRPPGARVEVDGEPVGQTPARREVSVGPHRVGFRLERYESIVRDVVATAGVDELVDVELVRRRRPLMIAGGIVLGLGLGAAATGGALLGVDQRPYGKRCSGDDVDFAGRCRFRLDTTMPGAITTAIGIAAVVTGVVLMAVAGRDRASRRSARSARRPRMHRASAPRRTRLGHRHIAAP